jgi:phage terminase small subunit
MNRRQVIPMPKPGEKPASKPHGGHVLPEPPDDLGDAGRAAWAMVGETCGSVIKSHLPILAAYCRQADRAAAFAADIAKRGAVCPNRFGHDGPNPSVDFERRAHGQMSSLLRELGIDVGVGGEIRGPRRAGTRG